MQLIIMQLIIMQLIIQCSRMLWMDFRIMAIVNGRPYTYFVHGRPYTYFVYHITYFISCTI